MKAAYRVFDTDAIEPAAMLASHTTSTYDRCAAVPLVLAVHAVRAAYPTTQFVVVADAEADIAIPYPFRNSCMVPWTERAVHPAHHGHPVQNHANRTWDCYSYALLTATRQPGLSRVGFLLALTPNPAPIAMGEGRSGASGSGFPPLLLGGRGGRG